MQESCSSVKLPTMPSDPGMRQPSDDAAAVRDYPLGLLLAILDRVADRALVDALHAAGYVDLRSAHGAVFESLDPSGSRVSEMARRAGVTHQSMTELVEFLVGAGYLEKSADPADRRAKVVMLTPKGLAAVNVAVTAVEASERAWQEHLGEPRMRALRRALEQLVLAFGGSELR